MANRVVINICGEELTFIAEESSSYMQRVGAYVNDKMAEVLDLSLIHIFLSCVDQYACKQYRYQ